MSYIWNSNYEHGRMVNYPNGRGGIDYQIADIDYEYDRYAGWRGLVEYMCKNLYTMNDIESDVCESTYLKLHRYNTEKSINKNVTSTLDEFLYD